MNSRTEAFFERVGAQAAAAAVEDSLPGIVVATFKDDELVHLFADGELRLGSGARPGSDSIFRIASMTKSFTAASMVLLRDRGALALDDPIARHLPWTASIGAPSGAAPISIRSAHDECGVPNG